jgi:DNA repair exonuclease SbcCD ATPase subunit
MYREMKKIFVIAMLIPLFIGCNKQKIQQLEARNDSLMQQTNLKDESINEFLAAFNDIQENLDSIKSKEMIITEKTESKTELQKKAKDQINEDINSIYSLMLDTRNKLDDVKKKLGKSNFQVKELEKMVENFTAQLEQKDGEIAVLRTQLEDMNIQITSLTKNVGDLEQMNVEKEAVIADQKQMIDQKTIEANTAYYVIGTRKELKDNNIITSEGGFIGIGKNKKLKGDFSEQLFTKIDIRQVVQIPLSGKKSQIVTTHNSNSFKISGENGNRVLEILNKDEFWKTSKYLVIIND